MREKDCAESHSDIIKISIYVVLAILLTKSNEVNFSLFEKRRETINKVDTA